MSLSPRVCKPISVTAVCLCLLLALPAISRAQQPLSLEEAWKRAEASLPSAQAARQRVEAAVATARAAGKQPNATIALAKPYGSPVTGGFGEDLILSQSLESGKVVGPRKRAAEQQLRVTESERDAVLLDLKQAVTNAYIQCLLADGESDQAKSALDAGQKFADAAKTQFDAGDAPRSNVVRSQVEVARFTQTLVEAQTARDSAYATLRSLLGLGAGEPLTLSDPLTAEPVAPIDRDAVRALALAHRPEVLAARAQLLASAADADTARGQRAPGFTIEGRRASLNPAAVGYASVRVGINLPLFDNGRIRAEVSAADATRRAAETNAKEAERTALLEVDLALNERERALKVEQTFEGAGRLAKAQELLEMAQLGYEKGGNGYLEVIDAQRVFASERVEYLRALAAVRLATARLERAIGGKLP
ncbi:MAG: TolC family protein [Armatimonas sp.]